MKRVAIHLSCMFGAAFLITKMFILLIPRTVPLPSTLIILGLFIALAFPTIWGLGRFLDKKSWHSLLKIGFLALIGSIVAWIFQLLELKIYHQLADVVYPVGLFEDEFQRSWKYVFPTLVIGEGLCQVLEKRSKWLTVGFCLLIWIVIGISIKNFRAVDTNHPAYPAVEKSSPDKPNVILILADDLGYGDISLNGNTLIQTPNIDSLAAHGVNFKTAYCSSPICAPSRVGLLTGNYQQRYGFEYLADPFDGLIRARDADFKRFGNKFNRIPWYQAKTNLRDMGLPTDVTTLADHLKEDGYATGVVGKWHFGMHPRFYSSGYGFDYQYGITGAGSLYAPAGSEQIVESRHDWNFADMLSWQNMKFYANENNKDTPISDDTYLTDAITDKSIEFIEKNKDNRFFLHLSYTAPHGPFQALKSYYDELSHIKDENRRVYYAMIKSMDDGIGEVMKKLKELNLDENTMVIFTSDNGGAVYTRAADNGPYYGGKMSEFEGGLIVPMIMKYGARLSKGVTYDAPISLLDVVPTVLMATQNEQVDYSKDFDGKPLLPYLGNNFGEDPGDPHDIFYWRNGYISAIRKGDYKLHINEKEGLKWLHNVAIDLGEENNLIDEMPDVAKELEADLKAWSAKMKPSIWQSAAEVNIPTTTAPDAQKYWYPW